MADPRASSSPSAPNDVLRGTLDLLILKTLSLEPMHGWAISQRLEQLSLDALRVGQGSLYPALQRLEEKGWVESEWRHTVENRRAKYYELTPAGRRALGAETESWRRYVDMVDLILKTT
ncbi:MAG TPA: PadR family transcriptional regulator [Longimicrobiaceae bacterium]|nr:PadR family transcriptional regulator [Longimicrobiaceae bacterium]